MPDRFDSFASLAAALTEEEDFRIRCLDRGSGTVILAPHGGTIEPQTKEIAEAIAGDRPSLYTFEAVPYTPLPLPPNAPVSITGWAMTLQTQQKQ